MMRLFVFKYCLVLAVILPMFFVSCTNENEDGNGDVNHGVSNIIHSAVTDVDGNSYDAVKIGDQVWMQSNLRTEHFRDRSIISLPNAVYDQNALTYPGYYFRSGSSDYFYNWKAVSDERGLCPKGWHVPTDAEWSQLEEFVSNNGEYVYGDNPNNIAKALASSAGVMWEGCHVPGSPGYQPDKNNATGFGAKPLGYSTGHPSSFAAYSESACFWSATESGDMAAHCRTLNYNDPTVNKNTSVKSEGLSVRCIRD